MVRFRRQRPVIVLLLTACLLLQQLAMSALACTIPMAAAGSASQAHSIPMSMAAMASMTPDCHAAMTVEHPAPIPDGVCDKHCDPSATSSSTPSIPPVPALALPPLLHAPVIALAPRDCDFGSASLFARSDPPPRLRYCRLLI